MKVNKKLKITLTLIVILLIICGVIFYKNNTIKAKTGGKPVVAYNGIRFTFVGANKDFDDSEVEFIGEVKNNLEDLPKNSFDAYKMEVGSKLYKLKPSTKNKDFYHYILIKNEDEEYGNNNYKVGFLYSENKDEIKKISNYTAYKDEEYTKLNNMEN